MKPTQGQLNDWFNDFVCIKSEHFKEKALILQCQYYFGGKTTTVNCQTQHKLHFRHF